MPRYAQIVVGPAGSGKSTYIAAMLQHAVASQRQMFAVNLDPAADVFTYQPAVDIRELIHVDDVMEDSELHYGPNGALVYAMEYLMENLDWLTERLGTMEDDYVLFDTPGQIELVSHFGMMKNFIRYLETLNFRICVLFLLDSQFVSDMSKYFSSLMISLITVINLESPVINVLTKVDKLPGDIKKFLDDLLEPSSGLLEQDLPCFTRKSLSATTSTTTTAADASTSIASTSSVTSTLASTSTDEVPKTEEEKEEEEDDIVSFGTKSGNYSNSTNNKTDNKFYKLSRAFAQLVDDYSLHKFMPLSVMDEEMLGDILLAADNCIQYGEDADVQTNDYEF